MSKNLNLDYYYGNECEQFNFYRIPKILITDKRYCGLSLEAKVLYGLMLDRMSLSVKNNWIDESNHVYIYFRLEEAMEQMGIGKDKGVKLFAELDSEKGYGLIERRKQGMGRPTIIYVKNFISNAEVMTSEKPNSKTSEKPKSRLPKSRSDDFGKTDTNNTNINNTELSNTELSDTEKNDIDNFYVNTSIHQSYHIQAMRKPEVIDWMRQREIYKNLIVKNIEYDVMKERYDIRMLNEIVEIMTDAVCCRGDTLIVGGTEFPQEVVKSRLLKLDSSHIEYIFDCLKKNTTKVRNIKSYLLTTLYNSVSTISNYYSAEVQHDLYGI